MTMSDYCDYLVGWLEEKRCGLYAADGYVLGISGGVDSAVCAHLLQKTGAPTRLYILPAAVSSEADLQDAQTVAAMTALPAETLSIAPAYALLMEQLAPALHPAPERVQVLRGNLMARLRMVMLYTLAQSHRALVVGTDNRAEVYTGYFTKYGDGAADLFPLALLRKEQVYALGRHLGVAENILAKAPSAGLWTGQTDEDELGIRYTTLDAFLRGEVIDEESRARIDFWHQRSHHKRMLPPVPELAPE